MTTDPFRYHCPHGVSLHNHCVECAEDSFWADTSFNDEETLRLNSPTYRRVLATAPYAEIDAPAPSQRVFSSKAGRDSGTMTL